MGSAPLLSGICLCASGIRGYGKQSRSRCPLANALVTDSQTLGSLSGWLPSTVFPFATLQQGLGSA